MKNAWNKFWNARFPIHNRVTTGLGLLFLAVAVILMIQYYLKS